jgi:AcrR family transcriptional regulator
MGDVREQMLAAAEEQLIASPVGDIATRAVCEAVGVTQPVLYRLFGDKRGLLDALADEGLRRYAQLKRELSTTDDPVADMRAGWVHHMRFARDNPALYQLMFTPRPWSESAARKQIFELLVANLDRCAAAGVLAMEQRTAAKLILSANVGLAFNAIADPALFDEEEKVSLIMRDTLFSRVLVDQPPPEAVQPEKGTARQLRAQLAESPSPALEAAESALLDRWLQRIEE